MEKINSVSFGKTSSFLALKYPAKYNVFSCVCIDDSKAAPKDPTVLRYAKEKLNGAFLASAESEATLRAGMDLEQLLGSRIDWVRGNSFDEVIDSGQKFLPSWARRYCTVEMKLKPIFRYWFQNFDEKVEMRIGFRACEFSRMERFFNNNDPSVFKMPISQKVSFTTGKAVGGRQKHQDFKWRFCSMPLIRDGITKEHINDYWKTNGYVGGTLFEERRKVIFPSISNCVGCFHKKTPTLATMAKTEPEIMAWFAAQEEKNMGTWLDSKQKYQSIIEGADDLHKESLFEYLYLNESCDSGGCTD